MHDTRLGPIQVRRTPLMAASVIAVGVPTVAVVGIGINGPVSELILIWLFLFAPAVLASAAFLSSIWSHPSRLSIAISSLCVSSLLHLAAAHDMIRGGDALGVLLGVYSAGSLACAVVLKLTRLAWSWRAAWGALIVHVLVGLLAAKVVLLGPVGMLALVEYLSVAAIGFWALHHTGTEGIFLWRPRGDA